LYHRLEATIPDLFVDYGSTHGEQHHCFRNFVDVPFWNTDSRTTLRAQSTVQRVRQVMSGSPLCITRLSILDRTQRVVQRDQQRFEAIQRGGVCRIALT
jgi:hypothetical protein